MENSFRKAEAKVSVFDHGLLYGDGVFEGRCLYSGRILMLQEHIDRLDRSAKAIALEIPMTKAAMSRAVVKSCKANKTMNGYIRLVVTRGVGTLGLYWIQLQDTADHNHSGKHPALSGAVVPGRAFHNNGRDGAESSRGHKPEIKSLTIEQHSGEDRGDKRQRRRSDTSCSPKPLRFQATGEQHIPRQGQVAHHTPPVYAGVRSKALRATL